MPRINKIISVRSDKSIKLHKLLACDGGLQDEEKIHVVSHAHLDHFDPKKVLESYQKEGIVVMSELTRKLLSYQKLTLDSHYAGLKALPLNEKFKFEDLTLRLLDNNHILGSCQVEVVSDSGIATGYSGDFNSDVMEYINVDYLVIDATYSGKIASKREWTYQDSFELLINLINEKLNEGPVNLIADSGLLQEIIYRSKIVDKEEIIIGKKEISHFSKIYNEMGYDQPEVVDKFSFDGQELLRKDTYLWIGNHLSDWPMSEPRGTTISVKNFAPRNLEPINKISNSHFKVALTSHAIETEIFRYIKNVNPKVVVTDSSRNASGSIELAKNIRKKMKIESYPSSAL